MKTPSVVLGLALAASVLPAWSDQPRPPLRKGGQPPLNGTPNEVPCIVPLLRDARGLDRHRGESEWSKPLAVSSVVAFSVAGDNFRSDGPEAVVSYRTTTTNTHPRAWIAGGSHFRAPVAGIYQFTVSFANEDSHGAEGDDAYLVIRHNGEAKGFAYAPSVSKAERETESGQARRTGSSTVVLPLMRDDLVHTGVVDDMKRARFIRFFQFTGVLLQPRDGQLIAAKRGQDRPADPWRGRWQVRFTNGKIQDYQLGDEGAVRVTSHNWTSTGEGERKGGSLVIRYGDERAERWSLVGDQMVVEHWHPASAMDRRAPVVGIGRRPNAK